MAKKRCRPKRRQAENKVIDSQPRVHSLKKWPLLEAILKTLVRILVVGLDVYLKLTGKK